MAAIGIVQFAIAPTVPTNLVQLSLRKKLCFSSVFDSPEEEEESCCCWDDDDEEEEEEEEEDEEDDDDAEAGFVAEDNDDDSWELLVENDFKEDCCVV